MFSLSQETPQPKPAAKIEPCDVVISGTPTDATLVGLLKSLFTGSLRFFFVSFFLRCQTFFFSGKIKSAGYSVFGNTSTSDEDTRLLGRMLVDAKVGLQIWQLEMSGKHLSLCRNIVVSEWYFNKLYCKLLQQIVFLIVSKTYHR